MYIYIYIYSPTYKILCKYTTFIINFLLIIILCKHTIYIYIYIYVYIHNIYYSMAEPVCT